MLEELSDRLTPFLFVISYVGFLLDAELYLSTCVFAMLILALIPEERRRLFWLVFLERSRFGSQCSGCELLEFVADLFYLFYSKDRYWVSVSIHDDGVVGQMMGFRLD